MMKYERYFPRIVALMVAFCLGGLVDALLHGRPKLPQERLVLVTNANLTNYYMWMSRDGEQARATISNQLHQAMETLNTMKFIYKDEP